MASVEVRVGFLIFVVLGLTLSPITTSPTHATEGLTGSQLDETRDQRTTPKITVERVALSSPENNSTVRHEQLEEMGESDRGALQQWFSQRLSSQLQQSAIELNQSEYEQAQDLVGESYSSQFEKYVDVVGETESTSENSTISRFQNAQQRQQEYVQAVQEYRETHDEYLAAKQNGSEVRARKLARELNNLSSTIQQGSSHLAQTYEDIANTSDTNVTQANQSIQQVTKNISTQQTEVRQETFTNTSLQIHNVSQTASFKSPLEVHGQLVSINGTPLADREIVVEGYNYTANTSTDTAGNFTLEFHPTLLPVGNQSLPIRYVPNATSVYLGSNSTLPVTITQTTPTVTVTQTPTSVAYNETVTIRGHVGAANVSAQNVPIAVSLGGVRLNTTWSNKNGSFTLTTTLPAAVPAGNQSLRAAIPVQNRALRPTNTTTPLAVQSTATELTLQSTKTPQQVTLNGTLVTTSGQPVPNETVRVKLADQHVKAITTNESGRYVARLNKSLVESAASADNDSITASVVYPGQGNLESARAEASIPLTSGGIGQWLLGSPWRIGAGLLILSIIGIVIARRQIHGSSWSILSTSTNSDSASDNKVADTVTQESEDDDDAEIVSEAMCEQASRYLDNEEPDQAVQTAYAAVRHYLTNTLDWNRSPSAQTYWEFYRSCRERDEISDEQATALKELTEQYEHTRFTTTSLTADRASEAVEQATNYLTSISPVGHKQTTAATDGGQENR